MSKEKEQTVPRKSKFRGISLAVIAAVISSGSVWAEPYVYPTKNQSNQKMEEDKFACYQWAKNQSGFDPSAGAPPPQKTAGAGRGAVRGAAGGAAIGAIAGNAGKGAAIGAATGGIVGGARRRQSEKAQAQQQAAGSDAYDRAWGACMEGKGYTVK